ncbi:hypothetical protein EJ05DRAFT_506453 [Pseudovirgaria hyperparasitica]|uniref:Thioredoxin-like fold domain-containing protein n=1 Tax=Pseudovirgaria hyperparasitica TaxID=470096 RepID=A0A6A6WKS6_9PEZI|nr:uncharacterized protein EJ05DRAFT_506453 [Pseudovirgaria hyperparasitica]KAF2762771.1 hypothetical protein EJ05DRAFT_506453 [Pseudovirgaria hyperparasitica]
MATSTDPETSTDNTSRDASSTSSTSLPKHQSSATSRAKPQPHPHPQPQSQPRSTSFWRIPGPLKTLFEAVPLHTYPANPLPQRAAQSLLRRRRRLSSSSSSSPSSTPDAAPPSTPSLWLWINPAATDRLSFNPSCLRWQAYLAFLQIPVVLVPSNNHASPSGALPFLISNTDSSSSSGGGGVVPSNKLRRWAEENSAVADGNNNNEDEDNDDPTAAAQKREDDARHEAYISLVETSIRRAWLYTLHHTPLFTSLTHPLYITPASQSIFIRTALSHQLRAAATAELLKSSTTTTTSTSSTSTTEGGIIDAEEIYTRADEAFEALERGLGGEEWFSGKARPGWLDAVVFGYTGLVLRGDGGGGDDEGRGDGEGDGWRMLRESRLGQMVERRDGLRRHRERIVRGYF